MMYHIPGRSAFKADLATLIEIADKVPSFVASSMPPMTIPSSAK